MIFDELSLLPSDLLRDLLVWVIAFFAVLTIGQVVVLITTKIVVEIREKRMERLKAQYLSDLNRMLSDGIAVGRPKKRIEFESLTDGAMTLLVEAAPADRQRIRKEMRRLGVPEFYANALSRTRSWMGRYRIIERLGFLNLSEMRAIYATIMASDREHHLVAAKAVWALSRICREADLPAIMGILSRPDFMSAKFDEYVWSNIIEAFSERGEVDLLLDRLTERLEEGGLSLFPAKDLVQALGSTALAKGGELILRFSKHFGDSPDMAIACVRALQRTGGEKLDQMVIAGLGHDDWRVRTVAAKNVENCSNLVIAHLELALGDQNYHVRMNAALSLSRKGEAGLSVLRIHATSSDRFIRDVSNYVLAA